MSPIATRLNGRVERRRTGNRARSPERARYGPRVRTDLSTRRVLVSEYVDGR